MLREKYTYYTIVSIFFFSSLQNNLNNKITFTSIFLLKTFKIGNY